jgi:tRNA dimethylallyltransferase
MNIKPKVVAVVGPTASGKSDLGVALAKKFNGEIISADSRQVYCGLDLGSGKITRKEMRNIPHHLIDVANPKRAYSVARYQRAARRAIAEILSRHKLPIIVGGTGLYVRSIIDGLALPPVPPNRKLREKLERLPLAELHKRLEILDPKRAAEIDRNNPRRLIRAIEIAEALGVVPTLKTEQNYDALQIGLKVERQDLAAKIAARLDKRLKKGMINEVRTLRDRGLSWKKLDSFGLEYRFVARFLQHKISRVEMAEAIRSESINYAKRQMTWFGKDKRINWISNPADAFILIDSFIKHDRD